MSFFLFIKEIFRWEGEDGDKTVAEFLCVSSGADGLTTAQNFSRGFQFNQCKPKTDPKNSGCIQAEDLKSHALVAPLHENKWHPNLFGDRIKSELHFISIFSRISSSSTLRWGNHMRIWYCFLTSLLYFPNLIKEFSTPWVYV